MKTLSTLTILVTLFVAGLIYSGCADLMDLSGDLITPADDDDVTSDDDDVADDDVSDDDVADDDTSGDDDTVSDDDDTVGDDDDVADDDDDTVGDDDTEDPEVDCDLDWIEVNGAELALLYECVYFGSQNPYYVVLVGYGLGGAYDWGYGSGQAVYWDGDYMSLDFDTSGLSEGLFRVNMRTESDWANLNCPGDPYGFCYENTAAQGYGDSLCFWYEYGGLYPATVNECEGT